MNKIAPTISGDLSYRDIENAANALSVKLEPKVSAPIDIDTPVMRGTILADRVAPDLFAAGFALDYSADVPLVQDVEDFIHLSMLISGTGTHLNIDGLTPARVQQNRTLLVNVPDRARCSGEPKFGDRSVVSGLTFTSQFIETIIAEDQTLHRLRSLLTRGRFHETYGPLRGLLRLGIELETPKFQGVLKKYFMDSCVLEAVSEFARTLSEDYPKPPSMTDKHYRRVQDARALIESDLANPLSIETICQTLAVNATTLRKQFRDVYGQSMFDLLRMRRLEVARLLLKETDFPVSEVGYRVGFTNAGAFSVAYNKRFGCSPSQDRS